MYGINSNLQKSKLDQQMEEWNVCFGEIAEFLYGLLCVSLLLRLDMYV